MKGKCSQNIRIRRRAICVPCLAGLTVFWLKAKRAALDRAVSSYSREMMARGGSGCPTAGYAEMVRGMYEVRDRWFNQPGMRAYTPEELERVFEGSLGLLDEEFIPMVRNALNSGDLDRMLIAISTVRVCKGKPYEDYVRGRCPKTKFDGEGYPNIRRSSILP